MHSLLNSLSVDNNLVPFHFCSKETLLKREKILLPPEVLHMESQTLVLIDFRDINSHDNKFVPIFLILNLF